MMCVPFLDALEGCTPFLPLSILNPLLRAFSNKPALSLSYPCCLSLCYLRLDQISSTRLQCTPIATRSQQLTNHRSPYCYSFATSSCPIATRSQQLSNTADQPIANHSQPGIEQLMLYHITASILISSDLNTLSCIVPADNHSQ